MNLLKSCLIALVFTGANLCAVTDDPTIAVVDGKLIEVTKVVSPKVEIDGAADPIAPGEIVILRSKLTDYLPELAKNVQYSWKVSNNKKFLVAEGGSGILFGAGIKPDKVGVDLNVTIDYIVVGDKTIQKNISKHIDVVIGSPTPTPDPTPLPKLGVIARDAVVKVNIDDSTKKKLCLLFAKTFRDATNHIGEPGYTPASVLTSTVFNTNNTIIKNVGVGSMADWKPLNEAIGMELADMYNNQGKLKDINEYKQVFNDIAVGLEEYANSTTVKIRINRGS